MALGKIGLGTKLLHGFGTVAYGIKDNGFNFLLLIFYNQLLGLRAQLVGLAIMIALGARAITPISRCCTQSKPHLRASIGTDRPASSAGRGGDLAGSGCAG